MNPNEKVVLGAESKYEHFHNLLIYKTAQHLDPSYLKKKLPDYLHDELSWLDLVGALKGHHVRSGAKNRVSSIPLMKTFFAEVTVDGKFYSAENSLNEKIAWIEVYLLLAEDFLADKENMRHGV
jgi:hypothetical protein